MTIMIWFQLWREFKLSIAEIFTVFPKWKTVYFSKDFLILEKLDKQDILKKANNLWWTIKIVEIIDKTILDFADELDWKFTYWLSVFWEKKNLREQILATKKELKKNSISSRFINKDFKNLSSAQIIWEKLIKKGTDFNYIYTKDTTYVWKSIWIQDINAYSKRDYSKSRDMQVWMLPPKLCQMMLNLSEGDSIYDPFVWLGTILIEALLMWKNKLYWSDLSDSMIIESEKNLKEFSQNNFLKIKESAFMKLNAKFINESPFLLENKVHSIVTEWYLWEIMTKKNISLDRIEKQKSSLISIYEKFFANLQNINYKWNLVICFPFWDLNWKYVFFENIYEVINKYCIVEKILPTDFNEIIETKSWSLLYKRDKQLVWREIFKLKIK